MSPNDISTKRRDDQPSAQGPSRALTVRRWVVIVVALAGVAVSLIFGIPGISNLKTGINRIPTSESERATDWMENELDMPSTDVMLVVEPDSGGVDSAAAMKTGADILTEANGIDGVSVVASYWPNRVSSLRSTDSTMALVMLHLDGDSAEQEDTLGELKEAVADADESATLTWGGSTQLSEDISENVGTSLARAEGIAIPVTFLLLILAFGSVVSGVLPVLIGGIAIAGTLLALRLLSQVTDVSIYALNLATAMGLGLAIDYSLLIVNRYREEVQARGDREEALRIAMKTAGHTVTYSAATVAAALCALLVFPGFFLRSFGYAGVAVVAVSAIASLTVLPAMIGLLGPRMDALTLPWRRNKVRVINESDGWVRWTRGVLRHPALVTVAVIAVLLVIASPALHINFANADARVLDDPSTPSRAASEMVSDNFADDPSSNVTVVTTEEATGADLADYARELSQVANVATVRSGAGWYEDGVQVRVPPQVLATQPLSDKGTWITIVPMDNLDPSSEAGQQLAQDVRAVDAPVDRLVGGSAASLIDVKDAIGEKLWLAVLIVVGVTLIVLFLYTGSVLVPVKAVIMNVLSLGAVFGLVVLIFQDGHLSNLLGFTATGATDISMPILLLCIIFGLSMDYEVFLLSRVVEARNSGLSNREAIVQGMARSGRIITTAAALMCVVFLAFGTASISFLQLFGIGSALAVIIDATIVRCLLVPAGMALFGQATWWAPKPLRALYSQFGLRD